MEIRNYTNLHAFNRVGMTEFWMHSIEYDQSGPFQNLVFVAGRGYMEYFGAKIKFIGMEYIASACSFTHYILRQASLQELPIAGEYPECRIYCFEDHFDPSDEKPERHYIVARNVEFTVHYAGENIERVFGLSDRIERGEHIETEMPTFSRSTAQEKPLKPKRSRLFPWTVKEKE